MSPKIYDDISTVLRGLTPTIVNVGSNDGAEIEDLLKIFPDCKIHAFEPEPRAIARFKARWNDDRVRLIESAVGRTEGTTIFHQSSGADPRIALEITAANWPDGWDQSGSIRKPVLHLDRHPWCTFNASIDVAITTLDAWSRSSSIPAIELLWADVQGAELDVIAGGLSIIEKTLLIYTEFSDVELYEGAPKHEDLLRALPSFSPLRYDGNNVLLINRSDRAYLTGERFFSSRSSSEGSYGIEQARSDALLLEDFQEQLRDIEADRSAKDVLIERLTRHLASVEVDRAAKDELIVRLTEHLAAVEEDRAAKDELIGRLTASLAAT